MKKYIGGVIATLMTLFLLYIAKDYPCLRGSGLAMADSEAFLLSVFIALPCLIWSTRKLLLRKRSSEQSYENRLTDRMAIISIIGTGIFLAFAIPLIFFTSKFPLRFICEQPYLTWLFKYPM